MHSMFKFMFQDKSGSVLFFCWFAKSCPEHWVCTGLSGFSLVHKCVSGRGGLWVYEYVCVCFVVDVGAGAEERRSWGKKGRRRKKKSGGCTVQSSIK